MRFKISTREECLENKSILEEKVPYPMDYYLTYLIYYAIEKNNLNIDLVSKFSIKNTTNCMENLKNAM